MSTSMNCHPVSQRLRGRNLYLIGMMGAGKSRTGPFLAKELKFSFVDVDSVIEQLVGSTISKFFEVEGETSVRSVESQVLQAIGERHSLVVATGGGVITCQKNWGVLHQGIVIWIDPGRERLLQRLRSDSTKRPLLKKKDPVVEFDKLFMARKALYSEADLHLMVGDESPREVAQLILNQLPSILRSPGDPAAPQTIGG